MKILLVGEYSRLHNSLKEGLEALGHSAVIVSHGDGFKGFTAQYFIKSAIANSKVLKKAANAVYKLTGWNLERTEKGLRFLRLLPKLKGFDHIQLINSDAIETHPWLAKRILKKLLKQNGSQMSLLVCGDETPIIEYNLSGELKYSILSPYLEDKRLKNQYIYSLKYLSKPHRGLFNWITERAHSIITSDLDYELPMQAMGFSTHFIPNPVNTDIIAFTPLEITEKVVIFLGINRHSYIKKGIRYFEEALEIIGQKYPDKAEIIVTENIPYAKYINLYNRAHILLDQVYAYDQGYNALEAMAKGKVVFTGAEAEFTAHYNLTEAVNVNALPDAIAIANALSYLIENPAAIIAMGKRARAFIEREHDYKMIAGKYLEVWGNKD
jgi:glycosyltransferase involved in cell wall biosynthesis